LALFLKVGRTRALVRWELLSLAAMPLVTTLKRPCRKLAEIFAVTLNAKRHVVTPGGSFIAYIRKLFHVKQRLFFLYQFHLR